MRRNAPPTFNIFIDFTNTRKAKTKERRGILQKLERRVFDRYYDFVMNLTTLEQVKARHWPKVCREALIHCYGSETAPMAIVLDELERVTRPEPYRCPYCLMRQPKTWDHFLAKEDFPEFSTLAPNLVRACGTCNQRKLRTFTDTPRRVLNPYFDPIPDEPLLWCIATINPGGKLSLLYHIFRFPGVPDHVSDLFERHFAAFGLQSDMSIEGATLVATFIQEISSLRTAPFTRQQLDHEIERKLNGLVNYPTNSWEVATFEGLLACVNFVGYVNARITTREERPARIDRVALLAGVRQALGR